MTQKIFSTFLGKDSPYIPQSVFPWRY